MPEIAIKFSDINFYQTNRMGTGKWGSRESSEELHFGRSISVSNGPTTANYVAKIKLNLKEYNLPAIDNTKIELVIKSNYYWSGAGVIRGYITNTNFKDPENLFAKEGSYEKSDELEDVLGGTCKLTEVDGEEPSSSTWFTNEATGVKLTFTSGNIKKNKLDLTESVYIYLSDINGVNPGHTRTKLSSSNFKVTIIQPYGAVGEPADLEMTFEDESTVYCDDTFTLNWTKAPDGANNPVNGYSLHCFAQKSNGDIASLTTVIDHEENDGKCSYSIIIKDFWEELKKGTAFRISVQAKASYGGLNSEWVSFDKTILILNKPPEKPRFTTRNVFSVDDQQTLDLEFSSFKCEDVDIDDKDNLTYYYKLSESEENFEEKEEKEWIPNTYIENISSSTPYLAIRAKDLDGAYSEWNIIKIPQNFRPTINFNFDMDSLTARNIPYIYIYKINKIEPNITKEVKRQDGSSNEYFYEWHANLINEASTERIFSNLTFEPDLETGNGGKKIEVTLYLTIEGDTFKYEVTKQKEYYNPIRVEFEDLIIEPAAGVGKANSSYLGDEAYFKIKAIQSSNDVERTLTIKTIREEKEIEYTSENWGSFEIEDDYVTVGPVPLELEPEISHTFQIILTNPFGVESTSVERGGYYYLSPPNIETANFSCSILDTSQDTTNGNSPTATYNWHPLIPEVQESSSQTITTWGYPVTFNLPYFDNLSKDDNGTYNDKGRNWYEIMYGSDDKVITRFQIPEEIYKTEIDTEQTQEDWTFISQGPEVKQITAKIPSNKLYKLLNKKTDISNFKFNPKLKILSALETTNDKSILTMSNNSEGYDVITQEPPRLDEGSITVEIESNALKEKQNWFHQNEKITFTINGVPKDWNDENIEDIQEAQKTIKYYDLVYRYPSKESWQNISTKQPFINEYTGEYITKFDYIVNKNYAESEGGNNIEFGLQLRDKSDKLSNVYPIALFACRKSEPIFNIKDASYSPENKKLEITLQIDDFGGNSKGSENFTRSGEENYEVVFQVSTNENFPPEETSELLSLGNNETLKSSLVCNPKKNGETESNFDAGGSKKIYIKATLTIQTNSVTENTISSTSTVYLLYLDGPTVAYRIHQVGINTPSFEEDEVFVINSFEGKKKVRLIGAAEGTGATINIEIDLSTGTITGATINGGSW